MGAIERAMGVLLVAVGRDDADRRLQRLPFWLLETFPALGLDRLGQSGPHQADAAPGR